MYLHRLLMTGRVFEPRSPQKQIDHEKEKKKNGTSAAVPSSIHVPLPACSRSASDSPAPPAHPSLTPSRFRPQTARLSLPYFFFFFFQLGWESSSLFSPHHPPLLLFIVLPFAQSRLSVCQRCDRCVMTRSVALSTRRPLPRIARLGSGLLFLFHSEKKKKTPSPLPTSTEMSNRLACCVNINTSEHYANELRRRLLSLQVKVVACQDLK